MKLRASLTAEQRERLAHAIRLNQHSLAFYNQGKYAEAAEGLRLVVAIRKEVLGERHPDYATSLNNLAVLLRSQGTTPPPAPLRAGAGDPQGCLGERHPDYATSLNNLAGLLQSQGDYAAATPLYEQALAIRKEVLGERHPDYATSLNNLAVLLQGAGGLRRRQAPLRAGAGDPQGGAGRAPPRLRHRA